MALPPISTQGFQESTLQLGGRLNAIFADEIYETTYMTAELNQTFENSKIEWQEVKLRFNKVDKFETNGPKVRDRC